MARPLMTWRVRPKHTPKLINSAETTFSIFRTQSMCHAVTPVLRAVAARLAEAQAPPAPPALAAAPALQRRRARTGTPQQRRQGRPHEGSRPAGPSHCRPLPPDPRRPAELLRRLPCHLVRGIGAAPPGGSLAVLRRWPMVPHWLRQRVYLRHPPRLVQCRTRRPAVTKGNSPERVCLLG